MGDFTYGSGTTGAAGAPRIGGAPRARGAPGAGGSGRWFRGCGVALLLLVVGLSAVTLHETVAPTDAAGTGVRVTPPWSHEVDPRSLGPDAVLLTAAHPPRRTASEFSVTLRDRTLRTRITHAVTLRTTDRLWRRVRGGSASEERLTADEALFIASGMPSRPWETFRPGLETSTSGPFFGAPKGGAVTLRFVTESSCGLRLCAPFVRFELRPASLGVAPAALWHGTSWNMALACGPGFAARAEAGGSLRSVGTRTAALAFDYRAPEAALTCAATGTAARGAAASANRSAAAEPRTIPGDATLHTTVLVLAAVALGMAGTVAAARRYAAARLAAAPLPSVGTRVGLGIAVLVAAAVAFSPPIGALPSSVGDSPYRALLGPLVAFALPFALGTALGRNTALPRVWRERAAVVLLTVALLTVAAVPLLWLSLHRTDGAPVLDGVWRVPCALALGAAAACAVPWLLGRRDLAPAWLLGGLLYLSAVLGTLLLESYAPYDAPRAAFAALPAGLLWLAPLVLAGVGLFRSETLRWCWACVGAVAAALLYLPVPWLASGYPRWAEVRLGASGDAWPTWDLFPGATFHEEDGTPRSLLAYGVIGATIAATAALGAAVVLLHRRGQRAAALGDRRVPPVALAVLVFLMEPIVVVFTAPTWYFVLLAALTTVTFGTLLLPARRTRDLAALTVDRRTHARRLSRFARQQLLHRAKEAVSRTAAGQIAAGDLTVDGFDERWHSLGGYRPLRRAGDAGADEQRALGTDCGYRPWHNGLSGTYAALVLSLPMVLYDVSVLRSWLPSLATVQILDLVRHALRWAAYGFVYGYFYPLLPGRAPLGKAAALMGAVALPEVLLVFFPQAAGDGRVAVALLLRIGEVTAFGLLLGLWWERRTAVAARLPWAAVRNLRSLAALGAPSAAVAVAVATAAATVLAGAATAGLLRTPTGQEPAPTPPAVEGPATPGP